MSSDCSMVCHGCDVFYTRLLTIAIPVIFGNVDFFSSTLDVFIVKTCYECVVLGISFCVNKASRSMHEVLSLLTVSGLFSSVVCVHKVPFYTLSFNFRFVFTL